MAANRKVTQKQHSVSKKSKSVDPDILFTRIKELEGINDRLRIEAEALQRALDLADLTALRARSVLGSLVDGSAFPIFSVEGYNPATATEDDLQQLVNYTKSKVGLPVEAVFDLTEYLYDVAIRAKTKCRIERDHMDRGMVIGAAYILGVKYTEPAQSRPSLEFILSNTAVRKQSTAK